MKTENLEMNTIQRKYHFESGRQAYTAWITIDTEDLDLKVVYRPKEFPELSNLPDIHMPIIIIQNDNNPNERFDIGYFGSGIMIDSDKDSFLLSTYVKMHMQIYLKNLKMMMSMKTMTMRTKCIKYHVTSGWLRLF